MSSTKAFSSDDLKHYPHFDAPLSLKEVEQLVTDKTRVAENKFYPFLLYHDEWQPYRSIDAGKPEKKSRPIRYGARRDSYIFAYYRQQLSELYEQRLEDLDISHCPIAYRHIEKNSSSSGKCNIDFAKDAFDEIDRLGDCVTIALDIKGYFESLDHQKIKQIWCDLIEEERLPKDHYTVFKNITQYRFVDQRKALRRLGYLGMIERNGNHFEGFTRPYNEMPKQLCSPKEFREKICGQSPNYTSLIEKNEETYGIPQGSPISDLIANFYLIEFDQTMNTFAQEQGGLYMRYSDDILLIVPGGEKEAMDASKLAITEIKKYGDEIFIKEEKTCIVQYKREPNKLNHTHLKGPHGKNGLEYLGFRYDGNKVYVRDSTISCLYRKVSLAAKKDGVKHVLQNPSMNLETLISSFDYSLFSQRFSKVKKGDLTEDYKSWTFYSYLKKAHQTFGEKGSQILLQARNFNSIMRTRIEEAITKKVSKQSVTEES